MFFTGNPFVDAVLGAALTAVYALIFVFSFMFAAFQTALPM